MKAARVQVEVTNYRPSEDEPFMNERQLEYFKQKLLDWKDDILRESRETLTHLQSDTENHPDIADRASSETDRSLELRTRDRQRRLLRLLRGNGRAHRSGAIGSAADRYLEPGSPGTPRTPRARPPGRLVVGSSGQGRGIGLRMLGAAEEFAYRRQDQVGGLDPGEGVQKPLGREALVHRVGE